MEKGLKTNWRNIQEASVEEQDLRKNLERQNLCTYGIKCLDDPLIGIAKDDLVVIGSDSGNGKSELAISIAKHNAQMGKKVALYYLEGGYLEGFRRILWKDICDYYYNNLHKHQKHIEMCYRKWITNEIDPYVLEIEKQIYLDNIEKYGDNLLFYNTSSGLTIDELVDSLTSFATGAYLNSSLELVHNYSLDLIIIDHLQYFSLLKGENEISEITKILRTCKDITERNHIPIVLLSHFRKKTKDRGLPDQEDFYGSSNVPKISSTSITIAPDSEKYDFANEIYPTYLRIVKSRIGIRGNIAMLSNFNSIEKKYSDEYEIYKVNNMGDVAKEPMAYNDLPSWAKGGCVSAYTKHEPNKNYMDI